MNSFVFAYDISAAAKINPQLLSFVKNNKYISEWSSPFDGCLIIVTPLDYKEIAKIFLEFFPPDVMCVISEIASAGIAGRMPDKVWSWLTTKVGKSFRLDDNTPFPELSE
jgi:hypothetical protein